MKALLIPGTWAWRDDGRVDWYDPRSGFVKALTDAGIALADADEPFVWDTNLGGVGFGRSDLLVWDAAGRQFRDHAEHRVAPFDTYVISHSHGLQVALYAAAAGLRIRTLVDVCGPVREDMLPTARLARPNITRWVHFSAGKRDRWQVLGQLFDGHVDWRELLGKPRREHPLADQNIHVPEVDHGELLRNPQYFARVIAALQGAGTALTAQA